MRPAILVMDDDTAVCTLLQDMPNGHVFAVAACHTGQEALRCTEAQLDIALVLLDMMLSDINGLMVLQQVQKLRPGLPVVMLTGLGSESDTVIGLEMGADDYIGKPFNARVLVAQVKAVSRCAGVLTAENGGPQITELSFNGWHLDTTGYQLHNPQQLKVELMQGEYSLLLTSVQSTRRVLSWEQPLELTRNDSIEVFDCTIDVLVIRLRREIENNPHRPMLIKTLRGLGYVSVADVQYHDKAA